MGLFGYGRGGLPGEIDMYLGREGAVDALADEIRAKWIKATRLKGVQSARTETRLLAEVSTLASILIWFHSRRKLAPTPKVAEAIDVALGVISPHSGKPIPSAIVLKRFGLPIVDDFVGFLEAARLDGNGDAAGMPLSQRELARLVGNAPSTIRRWREMPQYISRRKFVRRFPG